MNSFTNADGVMMNGCEPWQACMVLEAAVIAQWTSLQEIACGHDQHVRHDLVEHLG